MTEPWFKRDGWEDRPGLHAFIVGISAYAWLPAAGEPLQPRHYGMRQLSSPALTAFRLAKLLTELADQFDPPLATCRLLLAPSALEIAIEPSLEPFTQTVPDHDNFSEFAAAWRQDACRDYRGMTFFYFAGHGIERETRKNLLLLHDFGSGKGATFSNKAINISHLLDGMSASAAQQTVARKQVYFFDACRATNDKLNALASDDTGNIWDYETVPEKDDRLSAWFFAARPGDEAFAQPGGETLFGRALLECLRGGAGVSSVKTDLDADWIITINSLHERLQAFIDVGNRDDGAAQSRNVQFMDGNMVLVRLARPPEVKVWVTVEPDAAIGVAELSVVDLYDRVMRDLQLHDDGTRYELMERAGSLIVRAVTHPERDGWRPYLKKHFHIMPPEAPCHLSLERMD
jgi:hypothetical protein